MPNVLQTGAVWLGGKLQSHAGEVCTYIHEGHSFSITATRYQSDRNQRDLANMQDLSMRCHDFIVPAADLDIDGAKFTPAPIDQIDWTDQQNQPQTCYVFPRSSGRCYQFSDPRRQLLRIFTILADDLEEVGITPSGGEPFTVLAARSDIRGAELFNDLENTTKLLSMSVYIPRADFVRRNISTPPMMAKVDAAGLAGWAVQVSETQWGVGLVKLGLQRETLVREWQARRSNAAV